MTQEDVRRLLEELGGEATVEQVSARANETYPDRTLHTYAGQLLRSLEEKGFVTKVDPNSWKLTEKGQNTSLSGVELSKVDSEVDEEDLKEHGLKVTNLVGTIEVDREFDLNLLADVLSDTDYHPETSPFLVYRPIESATLLIPTNGLISVVGAKNPKQTEQAVRHLFSQLEDLKIDVGVEPNEILIQNIVLKGDLEVELDLDVLAVGLGLERCEYDPEQFPGIIFRNELGPTVLIFRTGKFLITGSKSYANALQVRFDLYSELESLGIDV